MIFDWMLGWNIGSDIHMIHSNMMDLCKYAVACSTMLKDGANTIFKFTAEKVELEEELVLVSILTICIY